MEKNKKILLYIIIGIVIIASSISIYFMFFKKENNIVSSVVETNDATVTETDFSNSDEFNITLSTDVEITKEGVYYISGTLSDGTITINTSGSVKLVLNNVTINSSDGPAINVLNAENVYIELVGKNTISATVSEEEDGAIYSSDDLILMGDGTLTLTSNIDGIVSKDDLVINDDK